MACVSSTARPEGGLKQNYSRRIPHITLARNRQKPMGALFVESAAMIGHYACRRKRGIIASHGILCRGISFGLVRCGYAPRLGETDLKPFEIDAIVNGPTAGGGP